jgi:hypothetical protein
VAGVGVSEIFVSWKPIWHVADEDQPGPFFQAICGQSIPKTVSQLNAEGVRYDSFPGVYPEGEDPLQTCRKCLRIVVSRS